MKRRDGLDALKHASDAEQLAANDNSYVRKAARQIRSEMSESILKEVSASSSLKDTVHALELAGNALSIDSTNTNAVKLERDETSQLVHFVFDDTLNNISATTLNNTARVRLETLRRYEKWLANDPRFKDQVDSHRVRLTLHSRSV